MWKTLFCYYLTSKTPSYLETFYNREEKNWHYKTSKTIFKLNPPKSEKFIFKKKPKSPIRSRTHFILDHKIPPVEKDRDQKHFGKTITYSITLIVWNQSIIEHFYSISLLFIFPKTSIGYWHRKKRIKKIYSVPFFIAKRMLQCHGEMRSVMGSRVYLFLLFDESSWSDWNRGSRNKRCR